MSESLNIQGFTNRTLGWKAWLPILDPAQASPAQQAVLEESHPQAKVSQYYLTLIHQPEVLRQRSLAFNAIMYAPGGLSRAERELASAVVSRINRCTPSGSNNWPSATTPSPRCLPTRTRRAPRHGSRRLSSLPLT